ncbi:uncharacterized protein LOC108735112 isoform X3 [Agrilus planipennis]|uniref:Uncharacterized protein LOC108735112 isoform X3 n=1 Tax=Agrilus planipennis TaxID=224129 RepID=A0A7F5RCQ0_AGRPL|nr:uncharacterized protein LOC108735112 isoform X3 [Agrilus planipennis]
MSTEKLFTTQINGNPSKLKICWCDNYFQLTILEADSAWTAMIPKDKLPEIAIQLDQDCESYNKALYSYLFNPEDSTNISFAVQNKSFIIHKQIEGGFRVKFFYTPLEKKEYHNCAEELLDELLTKNSFYENQISSLQQLLEKEIKERTSISEKYEEFQKDIENKEKTLYSSFVLLLNEKKKRIQYLTELLDSNRNSDLSVNDNKVKVMILPKTPPRKVLMILMKKKITRLNHYTNPAAFMSQVHLKMMWYPFFRITLIQLYYLQREEKMVMKTQLILKNIIHLNSMCMMQKLSRLK